jgi:serine/threonine protein kinase
MNSGDKLGPYEIVALIGKGGMGEVYRAHDPRLGRDVAIKVSAARFSERFEREARAVAALNHPNICTLYDVGPNYLVMEYIEGESPKGPMPLDEALRIARQIADALEAAHAKPIIHRDLKPANIKIKPDGLVKVLDFGLAKMYEPPGEDGDTIPLGKTEDGTILGTPAYMSPEQALGKKADKRADIWAFGVVLYELLTGERPFKGKEVGDILESVVKKEPDLELAPPQARRLLKKCLEKDATRRLNSARDMDLLLEDAPIGEPQAAALRPWLGWAAAGLFLIAATLVSLLHFREQPPIAPEPVRFQIPLPDQTSFSSDEPMPFAISPDGRKVAFTLLSSDGVKQLWIRALDEVQAQPLSNGQIASASWPALFWSPDSRFVAFDSGDKLYKIDVSGGAPQPVCDLPGRILGGSWNRDGVIVFGTIAGVKRVSASGGATATPLTVVDRSRGEVQHWYPTFLPDQRHFLYLRRAAKAGNMGVYLGSIDAQPRDQSLRRPRAVRSSYPLPAPRPDSYSFCAAKLSWRRRSTCAAWT